MPRQSLRSARWYEPHSMRASAHRQRAMQLGFRRKDFIGKPVIALVNSWDDFSTCHGHLRERANDVKRGVWAAGGFPVEIPVPGLGEVMIKPTSMFYRNLLAMQVEEMLRAHPVDAAVLMGGCDKTTVGMLMGALSADLPIIFLPAGPMLTGHWRGQRIGAGTHTRKYWDELRAGKITTGEWEEIEAAICRSHGTCNTMGTASTMTCMVEALGLAMPGSVTIPAVDSAHPRLAADCGERAVRIAIEDLRPSKLLTREHFLNSLVVFMALGGSTNAAVHLPALAGRAGFSVNLDDFHKTAERDIPIIVDMLPTGRFLMEDLHYAGGLPALMRELLPFLHPGCMTINGRAVGENVSEARVWDKEIIRTLEAPVSRLRSLAVLKGNLAPDGAVIKPASASPNLLRHTGKAVVFENYDDLNSRIDAPELDVDKESVLVLKNAGPKGAPGMPEWGGLPIPKKLLEQGIRDIVRISDARMSGTHFGTVVLHIAPESAAGGPLAAVYNGDLVTLDTENNRLTLHVDEGELANRLETRHQPNPHYTRGYGALYCTHVTQADKGCDFDFLEGADRGREPDIF